MKRVRLAVWKLLALAFLLPGLAGLICSAMISVHYLAVMPQVADADQGRVVPRAIHGTVIYQTPQENFRLNMAEYSSVMIFTFGLIFSAVFLEKWGREQARVAEKENTLADHNT